MIRIITNTKIPIKIWASDLQQEAEAQVRNLSELSFIFDHIAVMADAHAGKGSTVGTVIATRGAIIPAAVGVDIGCGMCAVKLPFKIDVLGDSLKKLRTSIERSVPAGFYIHKNTTPRIIETMQRLGFNLKAGKLKNTEQLYDKACLQLGTLGGGNHFIEICKDTHDNAWVMLHSGSRNIGKTLAEIHINNAKGLMRKHLINLPDPDLAYLMQETPEFNNYIHDLHWAQAYAKENRNEMMLRVLKDISHHVYGEDKGPEFLTTFRVDCHHNYTNLENHFGKKIWITRKGAVAAHQDEFGIIPGSMGSKSYIVKGKGVTTPYNSPSHK